MTASTVPASPRETVGLVPNRVSQVVTNAAGSNPTPTWTVVLNRVRNAAMAPRVTGSLTPKVPSPRPWVIPVPASQAISDAKVDPAGTSLKPAGVNGPAGEPASRYRNAAIAPRVTVSPGP